MHWELCYKEIPQLRIVAGTWNKINHVCGPHDSNFTESESEDHSGCFAVFVVMQQCRLPIGCQPVSWRQLMEEVNMSHKSTQMSWGSFLLKRIPLPRICCMMETQEDARRSEVRGQPVVLNSLVFWLWSHVLIWLNILEAQNIKLLLTYFFYSSQIWT